MDNDLLKGADAAAHATGLKRRDIYYLVECERVPFRRIGRQLFFSRSALMDALLPAEATNVRSGVSSDR